MNFESESGDDGEGDIDHTEKKMNGFYSNLA